MSDRARRPAAPSSRPGPAKRKSVPPHWAAVLLAVAVLLTATILAISEPWPDPLEPRTRGERLRQPRVTNSFRAIPALRGELRAISTTGGGNSVTAVGSAGLIISSDDAGGSWNEGSVARPPAEPSGTRPRRAYNLVSVYHLGQDTAFAGGATGKIARTVDGGRTWEDSPEGWGGVWDFAFHGRRGLAATDSGLLETTDRGGTWRRGSLREPLRAVALTAGGAFAVGADRRLYMESGGGHWRTSSERSFYTIADSTAHVVRIAASGGTVYVVVESGLVTRAPLWRDQSGGFFREETRIFRSDDDGSTWAQKASADWGLINRIQFVSADTGWAVTGEGRLRMTADGGVYWRTIRSDVRDASFADGKAGYVTTLQNMVLGTVDGGEEWRTLAGAPALRSVHFWSELRGVAVGDAGIVAETRDGGHRWGMTRSLPSSNFQEVLGFSDGSYWVVDDQGHAIDYRRSPGVVFTAPAGQRIGAIRSAPSGTAFPFQTYAITSGGGICEFLKLCRTSPLNSVAVQGH